MNQDGYTALIQAANGGHAAVVTQLLEWEAKIDVADKVGELSVRIALWSICLWDKVY